jgi:acetyl esterase/lipase
MAVASFAIKRGWMPSPIAQLEKPHDERLAHKAMGFACKPGDRSVITCGHDPLRTDGVALVSALRAAGVPTLHTHYGDMPHGFLMFSRLTRRAYASMDEMARETGKVFGRV